MKIHTTQNLGTIRNLKSTDEPTELKLKRRSMLVSEAIETATNDSVQLSFKKANRPSEKDIKIVIKNSKKILGDIAKEAKPEMKRGDKFLMGSFFNGFLKLVEKNETLFQAIAAGIAGGVLRPTTILAMPTKKDDPNAKTNNIYAASHAIASAIMGIVAVYAFNIHFSKGANKVIDNMVKEISSERLKKLLPHLDLKTKDLSTDKILTKDGKKFFDKNGKMFDFSSCQMLTKFKHLADISEESFKDLGAKNVNWSEFKGKSLNKVVTTDGKPLVEVLDFNKLGITFEYTQKSANGKDVASSSQVLFRDMDKSFVEKMAAEAGEKDLFKNIDIDSVFDEKGVVRHFKNWTKNNGKEKVKVDLNRVSACAELENIKILPRTNGAMIFDDKEGIYKLATFMTNGENGGLGTLRDVEILRASKEFENYKKALTWLPDLAARIPTAMLTIALIPKILKSFGIEKKKATESVQAQQASNLQTQQLNNTQTFKGNVNSIKNQATNNEEINTNLNVAFKGKGAKGGILDSIANFFAKYYGKPLLENKTVAKIVRILTEKTSKLTDHMATIGSLIVSSVYVKRTLDNKDMEPERKKTLAINQALCFVIPTIAAYTVNSALQKSVKNIDHSYKGNANHGLLKAKKAGDQAAISKFEEMVSKNAKGVRVLASLATFTMIYRYLTPVLITPIANKIGDKVNEKQKAKKEMENSKKIA